MESPRPDPPLRARQRAFREQQILAAAGRLLTTSDCRSLRVDEVAAALGTSKAAVYRHVRGREELLAQSVTAAVSAVVNRLEERLASVPVGDRLTSLARWLVGEWLGVEGPEERVAACCLQLVVCPYADWDPLVQLVDDAGAGGEGAFRSEPADRFVAVLRALSAVMVERARAEGRPPDHGDVEVVLAYVSGLSS